MPVSVSENFHKNIIMCLMKSVDGETVYTLSLSVSESYIKDVLRGPFGSPSNWSLTPQ
jgi:hypothetical protein